MFKIIKDIVFRAISPLLIILLVSCTKTNNVQTSVSRTADIYNPSRTVLHPSMTIHNINDSSTLVYMRLFPSEFMFSEANEENLSRARISIVFKLYYLNEAGNLEFRDSATINKTLYKEDIRTSYFTALPLKAYAGSKYITEIRLRDVTRRTESLNYLEIDRTSPYNRTNFRINSPKTNYPTFTDIFSTGEKFRIQYNRLGYDSIYVDYYSLDRTLPRPVFSDVPEIQMKTYPDTAWQLPYSDTILYSLPKPGIYVFKMEKNVQKGCPLYNFGESFPGTRSSDDLLGPLVFLTSSNEFRDLRLEPNRKLAIDNFWLGISGDMDDARELIRVYYNRVHYTNMFFTSYKEGWKTDRGMIYIVFGPPDLLEKYHDHEIWKYRTRKSGALLEFRFTRKDNLFSTEDYQLDRSSSSVSIWVEAVQSWKRGKIYAADY